ncbi:MAG: Mini-circle protein [Frankiales bacterium]|jgi:hypothetical protein|nr:Mini-circle protein [Frankiales bacterium]
MRGPDDDRTEPPATADERTLLIGWLDFHRATLARKCAGLSEEQLRRCPVPPSTLTLIGLVRHLTEIERLYIRHGFAGESISALQYVTDEEPEGDFDLLDDVPGSLAAWQEHVEAARKHVAASPDLDARGARSPETLRWVLTKVTQEYARHNGHADLLRQVLDGATGE